MSNRPDDAATEIVTLPEADVPDDLSLQVKRLRRQAWPGDEPLVAGPSHDPALRPVSMLLLQGGRVVAALDILSKELVQEGRRYSASGLSTVVTDEELQRQGHGRRLVEAAYAEIERSGVDLGLFTCDTPLRRLYERDGWRVLPGTVLIGGTPESPFPSDQAGFDKVTLGRFHSEQARRHESSFVGARIPLYPGEIDKLW